MAEEEEKEAPKKAESKPEPKAEAKPEPRLGKKDPKPETLKQIVPVTSKFTHAVYICIIIITIAALISTYYWQSIKIENMSTKQNETATELKATQKELSDAEKSLSSTLSDLQKEKEGIKSTESEVVGVQKQLDAKINELIKCNIDLTAAQAEAADPSKCDKLVKEFKKDCNSYMAQVRTKCIGECKEVRPYNVSEPICDEMADNVNLEDFQYTPEELI